MRKINTIVAILAVIVTFGACVATAIASPSMFRQTDSAQQDEEIEDCDAEDWINREDDCGFVSPKPVKTTAPKAAPKTGTTRR